MNNIIPSFIIDRESINPEWDQYVIRHPDGHYTQLSKWALLKKIGGWSSERVIIYDSQHTIIGGCQLLIKRYLGCLWLIYISKGPLVSNNDLEKFSCLVDEILHQFKNKFFILYIQPPDSYHLHCQVLLKKGFTLSDEGDIEKPATVLIDLAGTEEQVLNRIKPTKRKRIRQALRRGIVCRTGPSHDLDTFFTLHKHTSEIHHFDIQSQQFFVRLWEEFYPSNNLAILVAEYENKPIAILLGIIFKETFYSYRIGWSGEYANLYPNECLYGYAIEWARKLGLKWFDFGGIELEAARAILENRPYVEEDEHSYTKFKLHFSESVAIYPQTYQYITKTLGICSLLKFILKNKQLNSLFRNVYQWLRKR